ncbi:hypothetical protein BDZ89DRAFT_664139 [Hymenopellis radicata]|nr:hypothetical protein BDZ89DRAFT_664139 [Hymenopellis radicata]
MFTFILLCICNFIQFAGDFIYRLEKSVPLIDVQIVWPNAPRRPAALQTASTSNILPSSTKIPPVTRRTSQATQHVSQATHYHKAEIDRKALESKLESACRDLEFYKTENTSLKRALVDKENLLWDDPNRLRAIAAEEALQRKKHELENVRSANKALKDVAKQTEIANFELRSHVNSLTSRLNEASIELEAYRRKDLAAASLCLKFGTAVIQCYGVPWQEMDPIYARCVEVAEAELKSPSPRPLLCMSCCQLATRPVHTETPQMPPSPSLSAVSSSSSDSEEGATRVRRRAPADGEYNGDVESASDSDSSASDSDSERDSDSD